MNKILAFFQRIKAWATSDEGRKALDTAETIAREALPIIDLVAQIGAAITPTGIDDVLLARLHARYPHFFDGSLKTNQEFNLYLLGIAGEIAEDKYHINTSIARTAIQTAYTASRSNP